MVPFADRLTEAIRTKRTPVLVGLDPRYEQLPGVLRRAAPSDDHAGPARAFIEFCHGVIDVVAPLVAAVKPQAAFFEELGPSGMQALAEVIDYARQRGLLVILDGKRNDIGSTATAYARAYLGAASAWKADALTVSPYLGCDSSGAVRRSRARAKCRRVCAREDIQSGRRTVSGSVGRGKADASARRRSCGAARRERCGE